eukprot:Rhum_TRINITY_DN6560_c0_g1::Rhum_TRINITY_DN6560_c0_g1_i1::g.20411::m.20411
MRAIVWALPLCLLQCGGVGATVVAPDCGSGTHVLPSPMDGVVSVSCSGSACYGCHFMCPSGIQCKFTCYKCTSTAIHCNDASLCSVQCGEQGCVGTRVQGDTAAAVQVSCAK